MAAIPAPVPGPPPDTWDRRLPSDPGAHERARLAAIVAYAFTVATVVAGIVLRPRFRHRTVNRAAFHRAHAEPALSAMISGGVNGRAFVRRPVWRIGARELPAPFGGARRRNPVGVETLGAGRPPAPGAVE
ncbi:hypothetical protein [Streptomyces sp. HPF1205]|uniref:hypothetical protein n=1 Tax=Streptomyces sp. HPF1205 TaxID=2873262 RepID=UPI001CECC788|nr:hypothetical protein [Streptomyces sp. HPF1205]